MTHYPFRLPVDNADLPADLHCKGRVCQDAFDVSPTNLGPGQFWQCPGRREQATVAGKDAVCPIQGFRYPRKRTIDEEHHGRIKTHFHQGIDLGHGGQSVYSVVKGRVAAMRRVHQDSGFGGYGRTVLIRGENGYFYLYAHLASIPDALREGDDVEERAVIGTVGNSDWSRWPRHKAERERRYGRRDDAGIIAILNTTSMSAHLHFEVAKLAQNTTPGDVERTPYDGPHVSGPRVDPIAHLRSLGPWGTPTDRRLFYPNGRPMHPSTLLTDFTAAEEADGPSFPLGSSDFWHGGVHVRIGDVHSEVKAPVFGQVVAARLDEDSSRAHREFGSTNFLLLRHFIPEAIAKGLRGEASSPTSEGDRSPSAPPIPSGRRKMGRGCRRIEPEDLVAQVKGWLTRLGYYVEAGPPNRASSALIEAIERFQDDHYDDLPIDPETTRPQTPQQAAADAGIAPSSTSEATGAPSSMGPTNATPLPAPVAPVAPSARSTPKRRRQPQRRRAGRSGIVVDGQITEFGPTHLALAYAVGERLQVPQEGAGSGADTPESPSGPGRYVFTLLMHLSARSFDDMLGRAPWLARARLAPRNDAERNEDRRATAADTEDAAEAGSLHGVLSSTVGPPTPAPAEPPVASPRGRTARAPRGVDRSGWNQPDDVKWVQRRLKRHGFLSFAGEPSGIFEAELEDAIKRFQRDHVARFRTREPDGEVGPARRGPTRSALAKTSRELGLAGMQERLRSALREADAETGTTKVVTGFQRGSAQADAGQILWTAGPGGVARTGTIHWEMFSGDKLLDGEPWQQVEDSNDNLRLDASDLASEMDATSAFVSMVAPGSRWLGAFQQVRFRNEWSHDSASYSRAEGIRDADSLATRLAAFSIWRSLGDVVPVDPKVYHVHPAAFLWRYGTLTDAFTGTLTVQVYDSDGSPEWGTIRISSLDDEHYFPPLEDSTVCGSVTFVRVPPVRVKIELFLHNQAIGVGGGDPKSVTVEPGADRTETFEVILDGDAMASRTAPMPPPPPPPGTYCSDAPLTSGPFSPRPCR